MQYFSVYKVKKVYFFSKVEEVDAFMNFLSSSDSECLLNESFPAYIQHLLLYLFYQHCDVMRANVLISRSCDERWFVIHRYRLLRRTWKTIWGGLGNIDFWHKLKPVGKTIFHDCHLWTLFGRFHTIHRNADITIMHSVVFGHSGTPRDFIQKI